MKKIINGDDIINELSSRLIDDINNGVINAVYHKSDTTMSFYVNDINKGVEPYLTLRIADHKPSAETYFNDNIKTLPHLTTNISIEFPKLRYERTKKNKTNMNVMVDQNNTTILPFDIISYSYNYTKINNINDIEKIYINLLKVLTYPNISSYIDPFKNNPTKHAEVKTRTARIKVKKVKTSENTKNINESYLTINTNNTKIRYIFCKYLNHIEDLSYQICECIYNTIQNFKK